MSKQLFAKGEPLFTDDDLRVLRGEIRHELSQAEKDYAAENGFRPVNDITWEDLNNRAGIRFLHWINGEPKILKRCGTLLNENMERIPISVATHFKRLAS